MAYSDLLVHLSTFSDNHAVREGDAIRSFVSDSQLRSSIFFRNGTAETPDFTRLGGLDFHCSVYDQDAPEDQHDRWAPSWMGEASFVDLNGPDNRLGTPDDDGTIVDGSLGTNGTTDRKCRVPSDLTDLDRDGSVEEPLPYDLAGNARQRGLSADAGAFESGTAAGVIYVDASASGANDGSSWSDAFRSLQSALAVAASDNEIWVAEGTYRPDQGPGIQPGDRDISFVVPYGVPLFGGFRGTEGFSQDRTGSYSKTVLSGDLLENDFSRRGPPIESDIPRFEDNSRVVLSATQGLYLDGFLISGGAEEGLRAAGEEGSPCVIRNVRAERNFKQAALNVSYCLLEDVDIRYNYTPSGSAIYLGNGSSMRHATIVDNEGGWGGGAIRASGLDTTFVSESLVARNRAKTAAGLFAENGTVIVVSSRFEDNEAECEGGAFVVDDHTELLLVNLLIANNRVTDDCSWGNQGGGVYVLEGSIKVYSSTIVGNTAGSGDALMIRYGTASIFNSIIAHSAHSAADIVSYQSTVTAFGLLHDEPLPREVQYPEMTYWTVPVFLNRYERDYRLNGYSIGIDAGFARHLPPDWTDLDGDGNRQEPVSLDLRGQIRVRGRAVDLGAFESVTATGVAEVAPDEASIELFPNPSDGPVTLRFGVVSCPRSLEVFDLLGRVVLRPAVPCGSRNVEIDLGELATGVYFAVARQGSTPAQTFSLILR